MGFGLQKVKKIQITEKGWWCIKMRLNFCVDPHEEFCVLWGLQEHEETLQNVWSKFFNSKIIKGAKMLTHIVYS